ncbi:MAG: ankyrin repeat domain-containing protein [Thermoguttaceae bacterium]
MTRLMMGVSLMIFCMSGVSCGASAYKKLNWKAEDYFGDAKVIALCKAIEAKNIKEIDKLVADGADVNAKGKGNMTPLLWAFPDNKPQVFKRILEHGADPNVEITSDFGTNGLFASGDSVLHLSAITAFPNYFKYVMEHGGDPNLIRGNSTKDSPLMSVLKGECPSRKEAIKILVDNGADLDYVNGNETIAIRIAVAGGAQYKLALQLLEAGASFNVCKSNGDTFVHLVADDESRINRGYGSKDDYQKVVEYLKSKGADFEGAKKDNAVWNGGGKLSLTRIRELKKRYRLLTSLEVFFNRSAHVSCRDSFIKNRKD